MNPLYTSDGRIRTPARVSAAIACVMISVCGVVLFAAAAGDGDLGPPGWLGFSGWLAFIWYFIGWPAFTGREHAWVHWLRYRINERARRRR